MTKRNRRALIALCVLAPIALVWWVDRPISALCVSGNSMLPSYRPGDIALVLRHIPTHPGDVILARDLDDALIIKRLGDLVPTSGKYVLHSDNLQVKDRTVAPDMILGRVFPSRPSPESMGRPRPEAQRGRVAEASHAKK